MHIGETRINGQYEGQATGATFNFEGKTDILLRVDGKNAFIAECKFWTGEKQFLETIDQLLGYLSWRDTKAAILLFNRNQNFSARRDLGKSHESTFRHLLAFDVPPAARRIERRKAAFPSSARVGPIGKSTKEIKCLERFGSCSFENPPTDPAEPSGHNSIGLGSPVKRMIRCGYSRLGSLRVTRL